MVYLTRKKIGNKTYLYLEEKGWVDGKTRRIWQKYLGPEDDIQNQTISTIAVTSKQKKKYRVTHFGLSAALWQIAQEYGIIALIDDNTDRKRIHQLTLGEFLIIAAINRVVEPCSKSQIKNWFRKDWLSCQYPINPEILNAQTYWNQVQYLKQETIEKLDLLIAQKIVSFHPDALKTLFFDATNFYSFSKHEDDTSLLQFGHCKQNRNNLRLVNIALLCSKIGGIPLMHRTYPGNIQDAKAFKPIPTLIMERVKALGGKIEDITLMFDKGNHSPEAFKDIDSLHMGFIASLRNSTQKELLQIPLSQFQETTLISGSTVKYSTTTRTIYNAPRMVYIVFDPAKYRKHSHLFEVKLADKQETIAKFLQTQLNVKKWRSSSSVAAKIKALIGKSPFAKIIHSDVQGTDGALTVQITINSEERDKYLQTLGKSLLFTNRSTWKPEDVIWTYREQYYIEHTFRQMKDHQTIAIQPMFHFSDPSIRVHVFICLLSYILLSLLRNKISQPEHIFSFERIKQALVDLHLVGIKAPSQDRLKYHLESEIGLAAVISKKLSLKTLIK